MPTASDQERRYTFLNPLVQLWDKRIIAAKEAKKEFTDVGHMCDKFFTGTTGWLWKPQYKRQYLGAIDTPKFRVSLNKAFEFVAIYGPSLYWRVPNRRLEVEDPIDLPPSAFGLTPPVQQMLDQMQDEQFMQQAQQDPMLMQQVQQAQQVQQMYEQYQMQQQMHTDQITSGTSLMDAYLDYSQREQPGGGLKTHGLNSVNEALVKGRGLLVPKTYQFPGSNTTLTGCFHKSVDDLFINPDCTDPTLVTADWIALRHVHYTWQVERMFKLPTGSLASYGTLESGESTSTRKSDYDKIERKAGQRNDLIVWYEIWSKMGVGPRADFDEETDAHERMDPALSRAFDDTVGDFAYLAIAKDVPYPLNARARDVANSEDDDIKQMFQWRAAENGKPFPCYMDGRWPVACLDFYPYYNHAWPVAPLAPGLGELITLNVLWTAYVEQAYQNRKLIIAALKSAQQNVEESLRSADNPVYVEINDAAHSSINEMIQYLQRPNMNTDLLQAMTLVEQKFNQRVGLSEINYAQTGTPASRSARDIAAKEAAAAVRPEYMQNQTAEWMSEASQLEMQLAAWNVEGQDLGRLLGPIGAQLWDQLITQNDPETILRQWRVILDAVDMRKPNKEREFANISSMLGYTMPVLQQYAQITGDGNPINNFLVSIAESMEQDTKGWAMGPWQPPQPSPEEMQMQEQQNQLQMQTIQTDLQIKMLDAQIKQIDAQTKQMEMQQEAAETQMTMQGHTPEMIKAQLQMQLEAAKQQQAMQFEQMKKNLDLQFTQAKAQQHLQQEQMKFGQKMQIDAAGNQMNMRTGMEDKQQQLLFDRAKFMQSRQHDELSFRQDMEQDNEEFTQERMQQHIAGSQDIRHQALKDQLELQAKHEQAKIARRQAKNPTNGKAPL